MMAQPVLPSNAPPLRDEHASRVALQEHSANLQQLYHHHHHHYPAITGYEQHKLSIAAANVPTENTYAVRPPASNVYYPPQPAYYGQSHHLRHADTDREARLRVEKQWRTLYERFLHCPKYSEYCNRKTKDSTVNKQKWPEVLERAFFKALLYWPPMGRRKHMHKDKQRGRNELIADYITELTGLPRTRKQVSSHLQVLKPLVDEDKQVLRWMSADGDNEIAGDSARRFGYPNPTSYTTGRMRSTYTASTQHMHPDQGPDYRIPTQEAVRLAKSQLDIFEPFDFKLFVQRDQTEPGGTEEIEPLHTYSKSIAQPMQADQHIENWTSFKDEFPGLAGMHAMRPIDCNVIAVEASLAMPTQAWRDSKTIELCVTLCCMSRQLLQNCKLRCVNRFFKGGQPVQFFNKDGQPIDGNLGSGDVQLTMSAAGDRAETLLKFGSFFWAETLKPNATLAKSIMAAAHAEPSERARIRHSVDADLQTITAIQEIAVLTLTGVETILTMHWSFRLSNSDCGSTVWRRLHLPAAMTQVKADNNSNSNGGAVDTPFDFNAPIDMVSAVCSTGAQQQGYPASLQSPFEYDNGSTSDTSPTTTWPTTVSNAGSQQHLHNNGMSADASFDFSQQNMMFDPNIVIDGFDTTAFSFDASADYDFTAPDPNAIDVQMYAQKWANAGGNNSNNSYTNSFEAKQWPDYSTQASYPSYSQATAATSQQTGAYSAYGSQKEYDEQMYNAAVVPSNDAHQAYAGAMERIQSEQIPVEAWSASMRC